MKAEAKAYDEALERAKSEDEKIRKAIKLMYSFLPNNPEHIGGVRIKEIFAWLEKQGDNPAPINIDKMVMEYSQTKDGDFGLPVNCMIRAYRQGINDALNLSSGIEKQGEKKIEQEDEEYNGTELKNYDQMSEEKHWQNIREQAAIAAMQGVMNFFGSIDYNRDTIAQLAIEQANALVEELKNYELNELNEL